VSATRESGRWPGLPIGLLAHARRRPDEVSNVLCLCPNHHVLLDKGAFTVADDGTLIDLSGCGVGGRLRRVEGHVVVVAMLRGHRGMWAEG
jgi:putative restriction endonuclease